MRIVKRLKIIVVFVVSACLLISCAHSNGLEKESNKNGGLYSSILEIYQGPLNHLSAVRRGECPMYPSCSEYSRLAIQRHGFAIGWTMTLDRLMRCGRDELKQAPRIFVDGDWRYYDPVENNDFWWSQSDSRNN